MWRKYRHSAGNNIYSGELISGEHKKCLMTHIYLISYKLFISAVLCDASCKENGGECVKPGVCGNCPNGRRGSNCEIESKFIQDTVIIHTVMSFKLYQETTALNLENDL